MILMRISRFATVALWLLVPIGCSSNDADPAPGKASTDAGSDTTHESDGATDLDSAFDAADDGAPLADVVVDDTVDAGSPCTPPDEMPVDGPSGYRLDGWAWTRHGVALEDPSATAQSGYIAPAAVALDAAIHLWVTRKEGTQHRILHTSSTDGMTFPEPVATTGIEGDGIIAYPSVVHDGTRFLMWYGSGSIDHAQSLDGVSWTMVAKGVLKPGGLGTFDSVSLLYPNVVSVPSGYVMHYTGFDGQAFAIGRAESQDGVTWTRSPTTAVIAKGSAGTFDNHAVAQPCAVALDTRVLLWYGGYDTSVANPGPYRIGLAESADGITYERKGVTLDLAPSGVEAWSTRDPAVVRWGGQWWMAYSAMGDDGRYRIAVAMSPTCGEGT